MGRCLSACVLLLVCLSGCAAGGEGRRFQSRVVRDASYDSVFETARRALRREFGAVNAAPERGEITSEPVAYTTRAASGTARDLYRGVSAMRQVAHCRVVAGAEQTTVMLRVDIEREDTERSEVASLATTGRLNDTPSYSPIERDAATSESQNRVWTFVRRDAALERALLSEIEDEFATAPAAAAPAEPARVAPAEPTRAEADPETIVVEE